MTASRFRRIALILAVLTPRVWSAPDGIAQVVTSPAAELTASAVVTINGLITQREGAARAMVANSVGLALEESDSVWLWSDDTLCARAAGSQPPAPGSPMLDTMSVDGNLWSFDVRLVSATTDAISFELDWRRERRDAGGATQTVAGDQRLITLTEQDRHVLDFVAATPGACRSGNASGNASIALEVQAALADDPELANEVLAYEVWAVHEDSSGARATRVDRAVARHGELASAQFMPFSWPIAGTTCEVSRTVSADLRGRVRPDGSIDLSLATRTSLSRRGGGVTAAAGRKFLTVTPGEAVETVLPNSSGLSSAACGPTSAAAGPGVTTDGDRDRVVIDHGAFFAGHRTSLIVTVTRQP